VLAMEGTRRSHSIGSQIEYDEALAIFDKSRHHGFASAVLVDGRPWQPKPAKAAVVPFGNVSNLRSEAAFALSGK
jgi:hypothetical protein